MELSHQQKIDKTMIKNNRGAYRQLQDTETNPNWSRKYKLEQDYVLYEIVGVLSPLYVGICRECDEPFIPEFPPHITKRHLELNMINIGSQIAMIRVANGMLSLRNYPFNKEKFEEVNVISPRMTNYKYTCEGFYFETMRQVAEAFDISLGTVHNRMTSPRFPEWNSILIRSKEERYEKRNAFRTWTIKGIDYPSAKTAGEGLEISARAVEYRCKSKNFPEWSVK